MENNRLKLHLVMVSVIILLFAVNLSAQFAGGQGTEEDPWQVANAAHLNNLRNYLGVDYNNAYFIQTATIDLGVAPWNEGEGWVPIGSPQNPFMGNYDGNYQMIYYLTIDRNADNQGLFGFTNGADISSIYLYNSSVSARNASGILIGNGSNTMITECFIATGTVSGNQYIGGLAGFLNNSRISKSYTKGSVTATNRISNVGGLVGEKANTNIDNSYSWMSVTGNEGVIGGLVGFNGSGDIVNSFSIGAVSATNPVGQIGGLVGGYSMGAIIRSYWNVETSGQQASAGGGIARMSADMRHPHDPDTYVDWDFDTTWYADIHTTNGGYPCVTNIHQGDVQPEQFAGGQGTENDPWLIETPRHLNNVRNYLGEEYRNRYFKQIADIDLNVSPYNENEGWVPIGTQGNRFEGNYDGGSFEILNLFIERDADYQGLFGATNNSSLQNIKLINADVTGNRFTAGLVGITAVTEISNCYVDGAISGTSDTGGIVGYNAVSNMSKSSSTGRVTATNESSYVGGLVGYNISSPINNSFSRMNVTGSRRIIGGLVGFHQDSQISTCYATGYIEATHEFPFATMIGGLVGDVQTATVTGSHWDTETTGQTRTSGGGFGRTTEQMTYPYSEDSYVDWDFEEIWRHDLFEENDNYPMIDDLYSEFAAGSGTEQDPWIIQTPAHLNNVRNYLDADFGNLFFKQYGDIDLNVPPYNEGQGWEPIGFDEINSFRGVYDGNGNVIRGLYINNPNGDYQGLFGWLGGEALIQNLGLEGVNIIGNNYIGGIVARMIQQSSIRRCYVTGDVRGNDFVAGINAVKGCPDFGATSLVDCYSTASVFATAATPLTYAGGIAAFQLTGDILNSYALGAVTLQADSDYTGAVLGYMTQGSTCNNLFWNNETTMMTRGVGNSEEYHGHSTREMIQQATYTGRLNFFIVWQIDDGESYPYFQWQQEPGDHNYPVVHFADGSGTQQDPWQIETAEHLYNIRNYLGADHAERYFLQTADIDLGEAPWGPGDGDGEGWQPIGTIESPFQGSYSGDFHKITNLFIDRQDSNQGLFGVTRGGTIEAVSLENVSINATHYTGGIAGTATSGTIIYACSVEGIVSGVRSVGGLTGAVLESTITVSHAKGRVTAIDDVSEVGGLVGFAQDSNINNSYSLMRVLGNRRSIGGLIGRSRVSVLEYSYAAGAVSATHNFPSYIGGLIGLFEDGNVLESYWDIQVTGRTGSFGGGYGRYTTQMTYPYHQGTYVDWQFQQIWFEDVYDRNNGYPTLFYQDQEAPQFAGGSGTEDDPWQVETADHLNNLRNYLGNEHSRVFFVQTADIDLGVSPWRPEDGQGQGWEPIGNANGIFMGKYDGSGHQVKNMFINRPDGTYVGLFGYIQSAKLSNLGVVDVDVTGHHFVGGLNGYAHSSTLENSYTAGNVTGDYTVGGLSGYCYQTIIVKCFNRADVNSEGDFVGGLVGEVELEHVHDSYSTGNVTGNSYVGGLVGILTDVTIQRSYSVGRVTGERDLGGLIGYAANSNVQVSYWDTQTSGQQESAGGTGRTTEQMTHPYDQNTYQDWSFLEVWREDRNLYNNGYPYLYYQTFDVGPMSSPGRLSTISWDGIVILEWYPPGEGWDEDRAEGRTTRGTQTSRDSYLGDEQYRGFLGYRVYRDGDLVNTDSLIVHKTGELYEFYDDSVTNDLEYTYHVTAVYQRGESLPSNESVGRPGQRQHPPPRHVRGFASDRAARINWYPPDFEEGQPLVLLGYEVYETGYLVSGEDLITERFFEHTDIDNGTWNYYQVVAVYNLGESVRDEGISLFINPAGWRLPEYDDFDSSMQITGEVFENSDEDPSDNDRYWIGVFGPGGTGDCRGIAQNADPQGAQFTIHHVLGDQDESGIQLTFRVYDTVTRNTYGTKTTVDFEPDSMREVEVRVFNRYNLTINTQGLGSTFPSQGTRSFQPGSEVQIRAIPARGHHFSHWVINGDPNDENIVNLVMNNNITATAVFVRNRHTLTVSIQGSGTTSPPEGEHNFDDGQAVYLRARPDENHEFVRWVVGQDVYNFPWVKIAMTSDRQATAYFRPVHATQVQLDRNIYVVPDVSTTHSFDLRARIFPSNALDQSLQWSSTNEEIATVRVSMTDPRSARVSIPVLGDVRGVAIIEARNEEGDVAGYCRVIVPRTVFDDQPIPERFSFEDHPFMVISTLNITGRPRFTIDEGVVLYFGPDAGVNIEGELVANNVVFSGAPPSERNSWSGLYFGENSQNSNINGIEIINATNPLVIDVDTLNIKNVKVTATDDGHDDFAVKILSDSSPNIDSLTVENYGRGIYIEDVGERSRNREGRSVNPRNGQNKYRLTTSSLSNIRVRHSSESVRPETIGIQVQGEVNLNLENAEIENFHTGLVLRNYEEDRAFSTSSLTNIRVRHSSESIRENGIAILIDGNIVSTLEDVEVDDYDSGIVYTSTYTGNDTSSLTNIRVRHSSESVRPAASAGISIIDVPFIDIYDNEIWGHSTGLQIKANEDMRAITTSSLSNIRVRHTSESVRLGGTGILIEGNVNADIDDIDVDDYDTGIYYTNSLSDGTASLTNIRVRHSSESIRQAGTVGILLENMNELNLGIAEDPEIEVTGYQKGIEITTDGLTRAITTASLSNIRVRHSSESVRDENFGLFVDGSINLTANDIDIVDYQTGLYQNSELEQRFTSSTSLSNIRVRHTSESVRNPALVGMHFVNIDSLTIANISDTDTTDVIGYPTGIHIFANDPDRRSITTSSLSNIRVRHSSESIRDESIGFLLEGNIEGDFSDNEIEDYDVGVKIIGNNNTLVTNNSFIDCITGVLASGSEVTPIIRYNTLELPSLYFITEEATAFKADSLAMPVINNNTVFMYPTGLISDAADVTFFNNIIWQDAFNQAVILRNGGTAELTYNNISFVEHEGEGNISQDPLFVAPYEGNFNLQEDSPCIDAGDPEYDLDEDGSIADIGAKPYLRAAEPAFNPEAGYFFEQVQVSITCATPGTAIYYTLNGEEPDEESLLYSEPIDISETTTIKAKAFFAEASDWNPSIIGEAVYTEAGAPQNVQTTVSYDSVLVVWDAPDDGEDGRSTDRTRRMAFRLTDRQQLFTRTLTGYNVYRRKAEDEDYIKVNAALIDSTSYLDTGLAADSYFYYVAAVYDDDTEAPSGPVNAIVLQVPKTTFNPEPGVFSASVEISIICSDEEAVIRYTTNGHDPDENSSIYTEPLRIDETTTIKAKAFRAGFITSETATGTYSKLPVPQNAEGSVTDYIVNLTWEAPETDDVRSGRNTRNYVANRKTDPVRNIHARQRRATYSRSSSVADRLELTFLGYNVYRNDDKLNSILITGELAYQDTTVIAGELYEYNVTAVYQEGESAYSNTVTLRILPDESTSQNLLYNEAENRYYGHLDLYGDGSVLVFVELFPSVDHIKTTINAVYSTNPEILTDIPNPDALGGYYAFTANDGGIFSGEFVFRFQMPNIPNQIWFRRGSGWSVISDIGEAREPFYTYQIILDLDEVRSNTIEFAGDSGGINTLPVELSYFAATLSANGFVQLRWASETEANMLGYHIYKGVTGDLRNATQISPVVIPATNTSARHNYTFIDEEVALGDVFYYWLQTVDLDLTSSFVGPKLIEVKEDDEDDPDRPIIPTELYGAFPNPFNISTSISFYLEAPEYVSVSIYCIKGRLVRTLRPEEELPRGRNFIVWDGMDELGNTLTTGVYFYSLRTAGYYELKKMLLLK